MCVLRQQRGGEYDKFVRLDRKKVVTTFTIKGVLPGVKQIHKF